jgi:hypothetical protein
MSQYPCQRQECLRPASMAITLNVPAKGFPISLHQPIRMVLGLRLCRHHARETTAEHLLTPELKGAIEALARGKAPPDFDRAFVSPISLDSDEYQHFAAMRHGRST